MISNTQLKLYRAILVRCFGRDGLSAGPDATLVRQETLSNGDVVTWTVALNPANGIWTATFHRHGQTPYTHVLSVLSEDGWHVHEEILDMERHIQHQEEMEAESEAEAFAEARHIERLAAIGSLSNEELIAGYEDARVKAMRAHDCVQEWDWHPAYTGPDDPGRGYYEEAADLASEIEDAFASEMKRRGLYDASDDTVFQRALARMGYEDECGPTYHGAAKFK